MNWFKKKKTCVHCNRIKTKRDFENQATCGACQTKILISRESTRICPVDGATLLKEHNNEIIIATEAVTIGVAIEVPKYLNE